MRDGIAVLYDEMEVDSDVAARPAGICSVAVPVVVVLVLVVVLVIVAVRGSVGMYEYVGEMEGDHREEILQRRPKTAIEYSPEVEGSTVAYHHNRPPCRQLYQTDY